MTEIVPTAGSPFDALRQVDEHGREHWSARELFPAFGYTADWRNAVDTIERAKAACRNSGHDTESNFGDATEMTMNVRGQRRSIPDVHLSRYGAYLVAMNGDPRKPEIAAAQTYFAVKTREAETRPAVMPVPAAPALPRMGWVLLTSSRRQDPAPRRAGCPCPGPWSDHGLRCAIGVRAVRSDSRPATADPPAVAAGAPPGPARRPRSPRSGAAWQGIASPCSASSLSQLPLRQARYARRCGGTGAGAAP